MKQVSLHAEPLVWTLRIYDGPVDGHSSREPYVAVATVTLLGKKAWVSGLHGRFDRACWQVINDWLKSRGVESAGMERHGRVIERIVL